MTYSTANDPIFPDCVTPIDALLQLSFGVGTDEATVARNVLTTAPDWHSPPFNFPPLFNQLVHGSISHTLPKDLFSFTSVSAEEDIPEFCDLDILHGSFVIGPRLKSVVESFSIPNSEIFPIGMVLRSKDVRDLIPGDDFKNFGGGTVVFGKNWIWNTYNYLDLVDWDNSTEKPHWVEGIRSYLADTPKQNFGMFSNREALSLRVPDYANNPLFRILGSKTTFLSPDFARSIAEAGIINTGSTRRYATIKILPYLLDRPRHTACLIARRQNPNINMPPIRIVGTSMIEEYSSAMFSPEFFLRN